MDSLEEYFHDAYYIIIKMLNAIGVAFDVT